MRLTDEQWDLVRPLIQPTSPLTNRGRPVVDDRAAIEGILWKITTNSPWYDMPAEFPSHQTCYRRYRLWKRTDVLRQVLLRLYDHLLESGGFDPQAAIQAGLITFKGRGRKTYPVAALKIKDTWQYQTARIFIALAICAAAKIRSQ